MVITICQGESLGLSENARKESKPPLRPASRQLIPRPRPGAGGQNVDARGARNHGADPPQADAVRIIALGLTAAYWAG